jgi:uncharacterized protein (DUF1800 family)
MSDRSSIAWLARRAGFGLAPGQLDTLAGAGLSTTLDRWVDPDANGVPPAPDPWTEAGLTPGRVNTQRRVTQTTSLLTAWLGAMIDTPRPFEEWMRWFWHGHFVTSLAVVRIPYAMALQLRLFGQLGLGDFPSLLRAVTIDPAMLLYLNGDTNVIGQVNENYGREVLELFALGVGNYSEADVRAGATALTGWTFRLGPTTTAFVPARHDDTPQTYLGRSGVHDLDSVVDAIVSHRACAPYVTSRLARAILGPDVDPGLVTSLAKPFAASGLQIRPLVRSILEAGLEHKASRSLVMAPVPGAIGMLKACQLPIDGQMYNRLVTDLRAAGQAPLQPPNVGGWPGGAEWLSSSATLARFDLASTIAARSAPTSIARLAAAHGDYDALADTLGHPDGFSSGTVAALRGIDSHSRSVDVARLALALASPDMEMA